MKDLALAGRAAIRVSTLTGATAKMLDFGDENSPFAIDGLVGRSDPISLAVTDDRKRSGRLADCGA
jgi:hypothetical protein